MRAAVTTSSGVEVREIPDPVPGPGQVLARPLAAGVCGSDLHLADAMAAEGPSARPYVMGHEFCAEVVALGPETSGRVPVGTRVVSVPMAAGRGGPVGLGLSPELPGAFGELMVLQEDLLLPVPDGLSAEHAALTEPLAVGLHAVARGDVADDDLALVVGCGPVGLAVIAALKAEGNRRVIAADFSPQRRAVAERLGADLVLDPATDDPYGHWADFGFTELPGAVALPEGRRAAGVVAFECVGAPGVLRQMITRVPNHSRIVMVGVNLEPDTIDPIVALRKELTLAFAYSYRKEEYARTLDLLARGRIDAEAFVTGEVTLDGVAGAFAELHRPNDQVKIIVRP
ncbi:zinc-binding dehydrogenase [Bailinhaonella thermotolerans]|uniref:Alcohol dehydrogenase n=1 Tax=Bailinhaonella thermotolerans TaxID=1070861 RepID=A0A3A4BJR6_9ACTN|nr:zinc-binding dehydrogenase [Bailinhaonella thermotolerans]RJL35514.1 alcohol dehydrogenase [Bailinhaonella thermotolerans]